VLIEFTEEQLAVRDALRRFGQTEIAPARRRLETDRELFAELSRGIAKLGLLEIVQFDEDGIDQRVPGSYVTLGVACEELGRYDTSLAQVVSGAGSRASRLAKLADRDLGRELRDRFAAGELTMAAGFSEAEAGSDIKGTRTTARRVPGGVRITGEKNSVTNMPTADWVAILARETDADGVAVGFSQFLIPASAPGLSRAELDDMGWRVRGRSILALDDVFVPDGQRVGEPGAGLKMMLGGFNYIRASQALICVGAADATLRETVAHTSSRTAFGKPLAANQAVSFALAEAATKLEAARWMCYRVLEMRERGLDHATEAAMAKWWVPEVCIGVLRDCLRFNGHAGYSSELPIEQRLRDVIGFELADGASEIMKLIIARRLFGRGVAGLPGDSGGLPDDGQRPRAPDQCLPHLDRRTGCETKAGDPGQQLLGGDPHLEAGEVLADAAVPSVTEGDMPRPVLPVGVVALRIGEAPRVVVGRSVHHQHLVARAERRPANRRLADDGAGQAQGGRLEAQRLLDRAVEEGGLPGRPVGEARPLQQVPEQVADAVDGGVVAGYEDLLRHAVPHEGRGGLAVDLGLGDGGEQVVARVGYPAVDLGDQQVGQLG
jgi:cyclohexanecarboxyl-CoA dehydrogenase